MLEDATRVSAKSDLNESEINVLNLIQSKSDITQAEIADNLKLNFRTIGYIIASVTYSHRLCYA